MPTAPKTFRPKHVATARRVERASKETDPFYYSAAWIRLRDMVRAEEPICRECEKRGRTTLTEQIDHIEPRSKRPDLELVRENLQGLCRGCHNAKTRAESRLSDGVSYIE